MENYYLFGEMKLVSSILINERNNIRLFEFVDEKEISKCLIDLKVDGLIFDHAETPRDEYSTTENLFVGKI